MTFFKNILNRIAGITDPPSTSDAQGQSTPLLHLAAFGKHPAWDDHIEDIGLDTQRLVDVKRALYLQGIGANLDAGTWENLAADQRLDHFDHFFWWRADGSDVIGQAVASTDGKGRGRFPMIAAVQCRALEPGRIATQVAPLLRDTLARARRAATQQEVRSILAETQTSLNRLLSASIAPSKNSSNGDGLPPQASPPPPPTDSPAPNAPAISPALADLARCPQLQGEPPKLHPILFQIEREMAAFIPDATGKSAVSSAPAAHLRVPACFALPEESARLWIELLSTRLDANAPVLAVVPIDAGWTDLLVGQPRSQDLFCLLASRMMLPFTTDIPFTLNPAFQERAAQWVSGFAPPTAAAGDHVNERAVSG